MMTPMEMLLPLIQKEAPCKGGGGRGGRGGRGQTNGLSAVMTPTEMLSPLIQKEAPCMHAV